MHGCLGLWPASMSALRYKTMPFAVQPGKHRLFKFYVYLFLPSYHISSRVIMHGLNIAVPNHERTPAKLSWITFGQHV